MTPPREQRMQDELRNIHDSMKKQAVGLEAIEKNRKLSQIPLKVYCGKGSASGLKRLKLASLRLGRPTSKSNRGFEALVDSGTFTVSQLVESEGQPLPGTESQVITLEKQDVLAETKEETQDLDVTDARVDTSDTNDDETGDKWEDQQDGNHSSLSKSLIMVRREKPQNRQYDLVWRNGDIFSIGTDTDVYKAAFEAQLGDHQSVTMFRLDDLLENLTDAQQGQDATSQNDLRDVLALEMPFPDESDTEPTTKSFSIQIDYQRPTYAFVGNGVDLGQSIFDTTTSLPFCVWVICDLQPCQIFALQEPCNGACKHVRLAVMDISTLQRALPYTMTFRSMSYSLLLDEEAVTGTQEELALESFNRCQKKNGCRHTVVEGVASPEACCVRPVNLRAWLGDDVVEREAVTSTEDGASYDDSISVEPTLDDDDDDDDERALDLWQAVMNGMANGSDIPARIELDVLVSYIKVVDKYKLGELYLSQGLAWADALLPNMSTSFDDDAMAWLWILWRLHMPTEFKTLSAIIAQQAQGRIGPEHDRHGVEIPESIIDAIEQRRVHALSQVRGCVHQEIKCCKDYAGLTWVHESVIMSSAVIVEYLTLETQKHLPDAQEGYNPNFPGVSFKDTAKWIRSMIKSRDWRIRAVPPARRRFQFLANLSFFVPFLRVGLHEVEYCSGLFSHVYEELTDLITRLKAEDWGMDLDRLTCEL